MVKSRGIHSLPNRGKSISWLTPPEIIESLGPIDLDPCAHPKMPWKTAKTMISPPDNGLKVKWEDYDLTFINPPYGAFILPKWASKTVRSAKKGANNLLLVPSRTEVERWFWPYIWEKADAILFLRGRLYFRRPDGTRLGNSGHASVIAAYGELAVKRLRDSGIKGIIIEPKNGDMIK